MSILKVENFNKYLQKLFLISILLSLSLIPWIEFINSNLNELDFIFNDNLVILLSLYFLLIFSIYLILKNFLSLKEYSLITFILLSIWTLFQHNFLKNKIKVFFQNINISNEYSSEIALIIILLFVYIFFTLIKKKKDLYNIFSIFFNFQSFFHCSSIR